MAVHSRVDQNGRVTLPYSVRKLLGVTAGGSVEFSIDPSGVVTVVSDARGVSYNHGDFTDLARETAAQRLAAERGLAALRGGVFGSESDI